MHEVCEHGTNARNGAVTSCGSPSVPEGLKAMRLSRIFFDIGVPLKGFLQKNAYHFLQ